MSVQEAALYGDLVLALHDYAAEQLAPFSPDKNTDAARTRVDDFIRTWFFTPQKELYGSAPREIIWREQLGKANVLPKEHTADAFGDDCPICQEIRGDIESAEESVDHGYHWLDPELHRAARTFAEHCDIPLPATSKGAPYRRTTKNEALSLVVGLHRQGVDIQALLAQIEAWPYQNVALDWLSEPERNVALVCQAMETVIAPDDADELARFHHHRDFILALVRLISPGVRLWLNGWLDAVAYGAMLGGSVDAAVTGDRIPLTSRG